jgi:hypothetical protein
MEGTAVLKLSGRDAPLACSVLKEELPRVVVSLANPASDLTAGQRGVLIENRMGQPVARCGHVANLAEGLVAFEVEPSTGLAMHRPAKLTDCQLPAMVRAKSEDGHFGGWRGGLIVRHSPNTLHLQVEEGLAVPRETELLFSPIGGDAGGPGRLYADESGMMNAADVRSRRIRVRGVTKDVLTGDPGTVTLVVEISRTLYRAA